MSFDRAQKLQVGFIRDAAMNDEHFVIDNGSNWEQAEHVLKELEDFSPVGLQKIRIDRRALEETQVTATKKVAKF